MKLVKSALMILAMSLPFAAHADYDACKQVFEACAAQGYAKDETAPVGKKIWLNCASTIIEKKKAVAKVDMRPDEFDANNCRDYRAAKEKFNADWEKAHPRP